MDRTASVAKKLAPVRASRKSRRLRFLTYLIAFIKSDDRPAPPFASIKLDMMGRNLVTTSGLRPSDWNEPARGARPPRAEAPGIADAALPNPFILGAAFKSPSIPGKAPDRFV